MFMFLFERQNQTLLSFAKGLCRARGKVLKSEGKKNKLQKITERNITFYDSWTAKIFREFCGSNIYDMLLTAKSLLKKKKSKYLLNGTASACKGPIKR